MDYNKEILGLFDNIEDLRGTLKTNPKVSWKKRDPSKIQGLVIHQELGWSSVENVAKYHTGPDSHLKAGGVHSISYTFAVRRDGSLCLCNDLENKTWSQGMKGNDIDENEAFVGCMFEGLFLYDGNTNAKAGEPSLAQMKTAILLWETLRDHYKWSNSALTGHYHWGKPACPGDTLKSFVELVRADKDLYKNDYDASTLVLNDPYKRQLSLKLLGYSIGVDGIWGNGSKEVLKDFQGDNGLVVDGLFGNGSATKIEECLEKEGLEEKLFT
jgi:hypothetical protein